jgi:hypothetical protein
VRRVLARAFEIAASEDDAGAEPALTRGEVERAAAELGLPKEALDQAFGAGGEPGGRRFEPTGFLGAPTRLLHETELDGAPDEEDREDLLDLIQRVTGEMGTMTLLGKTLTWQTNLPQGRGRQLSVRLRTRDGRTRVVIEERLTGPAVGLFVGLGVGGGIGPMGAYIAAIVKLGAMGLVFPLLWIPLMLLLARTIFVGLAQRREARLLSLLGRIEEASRGWPRGAEAPVRAEKGEKKATRRRVRAEDGAEEQPAAEEDEAAAEEEALDGEARAGKVRSR